MYKDIINYQLAEGVSEAHLLGVAADIIKNWMSKQPGFVKWEIHKNEEGGYIDIVYWASKDYAKKAEAEMVNIPNANDWFSCYKEGSISSNPLHRIGAFE